MTNKKEEIQNLIDIIKNSENDDRRQLGFTQYQMNYLISDSQELAKQVSLLEMIWHNRNNFKEEIDISEVLANQIYQIKSQLKYIEERIDPI